MPDISEKKIYNALLKYKLENERISIKSSEIILSLNPVDIHNMDRPDSILWIDISFKLFNQNLKVKIPIPIEAEKGGIYGGALEDLSEFVKRKKYFIELPMLVIAEKGYETIEKEEIFPVRFIINQIPVRLLEEK